MRWHEDEESEGFESVSEAGRYMAEVTEVREKKTRDGDNMWSVCFKEVEAGVTLCWDNLPFSKRGKGISLKKIGMMGIEKDAEGYRQLQSKDDLVGLRCFLTVKSEKYTDKNNNEKEHMVVDSDGGDFMGYEPEMATQSAGVDDIPF